MENLQVEVTKANDQLVASQKSAGSIYFEVVGTNDPNEPIIQLHKKAKMASTVKVPLTPAMDQHTGLGYVTPAGKTQVKKWTLKYNAASGINYWEDESNGGIEVKNLVDHQPPTMLLTLPK